MKKNFPDELQRHEITEIILSKFIDNKNMIRKMVYGQDLGENEKNFEQLCDTGIVRKEMRSAKEIYYELSHDRLLFAIIEAQKEVSETRKTETLQKAYEEIKNIEIELQQNPDDFNLHKKLGDAYVSANDYKKSINSYTTAIEKAAEKSAPILDLLRARADAYYYLGEIEASNRDYEQILLSEPNDLSANFYMAYNFYSTRQYETAEKYYTKVLEIEPQNIPANYNLGLIAERHENYERAISQYEYVLSLEPKYENALVRLSNIYYDHFKDYAVAEKYLLKITEINPQAPDAYFNLGLIYRKTDQEKAISSFKKSLEVNPKDSEACYYLAAIYSDSKEYEKAMYYFTRCTDLNPSNAR
jgi:tetratricopeptide (TPR) repeat protein